MEDLTLSQITEAIGLQSTVTILEHDKRQIRLRTFGAGGPRESVASKGYGDGATYIGYYFFQDAQKFVDWTVINETNHEIYYTDEGAYEKIRPYLKGYRVEMAFKPKVTAYVSNILRGELYSAGASTSCFEGSCNIL